LEKIWLECQCLYTLMNHCLCCKKLQRLVSMLKCLRQLHILKILFWDWLMLVCAFVLDMLPKKIEELNHLILYLERLMNLLLIDIDTLQNKWVIIHLYQHLICKDTTMKSLHNNVHLLNLMVDIYSINHKRNLTWK
jgi:hypothetical protein